MKGASVVVAPYNKSAHVMLDMTLEHAPVFIEMGVTHVNLRHTWVPWSPDELVEVDFEYLKHITEPYGIRYFYAVSCCKICDNPGHIGVLGQKREQSLERFFETLDRWHKEHDHPVDDVVAHAAFQSLLPVEKRYKWPLPIALVIAGEKATRWREPQIAKMPLTESLLMWGREG